MVKQRMSTADVAGETACLRHKLLGMRVANVYDVNPKVPQASSCSDSLTLLGDKCVSWIVGPTLASPGGLQTYIIKLSRSGENGEKAHLVLESGTRFHTTQAGALAK